MIARYWLKRNGAAHRMRATAITKLKAHLAHFAGSLDIHTGNVEIFTIFELALIPTGCSHFAFNTIILFLRTKYLEQFNLVLP